MSYQDIIAGLSDAKLIEFYREHVEIVEKHTNSHNFMLLAFLREEIDNRDLWEEINIDDCA